MSSVLQASPGSRPEPVFQLPARLAWRVSCSEIIFSDPPTLVLQAIPIFPLAHPLLAARGILWDPFSLLESLRRPGGHQVLTSACGIPDDAGLGERIQVSHPDAQTLSGSWTSMDCKPLWTMT